MSDFGLIALGAAEAYTDKKISQIPIPKAWLGNTTTVLSEGSTANPITIDNKPVTAESGNIAAYDDTEYIFTGTVWQKFGGKFTDLTDVRVDNLEYGDMIIWDSIKNKYVNSNNQTIKIVSWADGTDEEIVNMLNYHYQGMINIHDYWTVGDIRQVTLSAMDATGVGESHVQQTVNYVLSHAGGKTLSDGVTECVFQVDQVRCLIEPGYVNSTDTNTGGWKDSNRRTWCNSVYKNAVPETLRGIFKEFINQSGIGDGSSSGVENTIDTFALRAEIELWGTTQYSVSGEGTQIDWYLTAENREVNCDF